MKRLLVSILSIALILGSTVSGNLGIVLADDSLQEQSGYYEETTTSDDSLYEGIMDGKQTVSVQSVPEEELTEEQTFEEAATEQSFGIKETEEEPEVYEESTEERPLKESIEETTEQSPDTQEVTEASEKSAETYDDSDRKEDYVEKTYAADEPGSEAVKGTVAEETETTEEATEAETPAPVSGKKGVLKAPLKAPAAGDYQITSADVNEVKTYVKKTDSSGSNWQEATTVGDGDAVKFDIKYHINAGSVTNGKMYYELPAGIANLNTTDTFNIVDSNDPGKSLGTYKISYDSNTGKYTIEMALDPSFNYSQSFDGTISVEGEAKNNKTSGNDVIDFGGSHTVTVAQERSIADFSLRKQGGNRTPDGQGGGTVYFEYFIGSYNGTNVIHITDTATAQNVDVDISQNVTITYSKGTYKGGTVYPENFTGWGSAQTMTVSGANFKNGVTYDLPALDAMEGYWVRYSVPYKADPNAGNEEKKVTNTVKATTTNAPDDQSVAGTTWDKPTIKKTSTKPSNNKAIWTITIGESGQDLSGFILKDVLTTEPAGALESLGISQPKTMTITSINGNAANKKITLTNGSYTFPEGTTGYLVLKYTTTLPIIPSSTVKLINTATLTTDEGEETAIGEEEFVGIPGQYQLTKLGPDELEGGDTTNTAVKNGDDITMSWRSTITLPGSGMTADLDKIYYYDYTQINGSSSSAPTNNWVTKNTLKNDLVIKNSDGETLARGTDYVVLVNYQKNDPTYSETKNYYENSAYNRMFNIDQAGYSNAGYEQTLPDAKQGRFQILFLKTDKIADQSYLTIDYKTYGTLPAEGSTHTYKNNAKIGATDERSAEHVETMEQNSLTIEKKVQEEPGSEKYVDNPVWWYSSNASKNQVGYRVRVGYNPDAAKQIPIIITDILPEGMEYVADSGEVGQWQYTKGATTFIEKNVPLDSSKYSVSYDASTRTITVTIIDYDTSTGIISAFGRDWGPYPIESVDFYYKAKLNDDVWNNKDTVQKRYANKATLDGQDDEAVGQTTFLRPKNNNTKGSVRITDYDSNNAPVTDSVHEKYYLIINPQSKDLDPDNDTLVVDDTITVPDSVSAEFLYDEFKVYKFEDQIPKNPSADDLTSGTELPSSQYSYTYDEHTHNLKVTVPDEQGLVIVYGYRYVKNTDSNPTVTNTANILGVSDSSSGDSTVINANNASATITQRNFKIRKVEEGNTGKLLKGSKFELVRYEANRDSTGKLDTSSVNGTKTVVGTKDNSDGTMTLVLQNEIGTTGTSSSDDVAPYTLFSLRETTVPAGYTADTTQLYFFAWKDINDTDSEAYDKLKTAYGKAKDGATDGSSWPAFPDQADITFAANTGTLNVGNTPKVESDTYDLTIKKETEETSTESFTFNVTFGAPADSTGGSIDPLPDFSDSNITKTDEGKYTVTVKAGQQVTMKDIPEGYSYIVSENARTDWELVSVNGDTSKTSASGDLTANAIVTFKNKKKPVDIQGGICIEKTIAGNDTSTSDEFEFTITLKTTDEIPIVGDLIATKKIGTAITQETLVFDENGQCKPKLRAGETLTIKDLDYGVKYTVKETDKGGYENADDEKSGSISGTDIVSLKFENTKNTYGDLKVTKKITGIGKQTDSFAFKITLKNADNTPVANKTFGSYTTDANGEITFKLKGNESITVPDIDNGIRYEIAETDSATKGYETVSWDKTTSGTITGKNPKETVSYTATNEKKSTTVSGKKTWVDEGLTHVNKDEVKLVLKRSVEGGTAETVTGVTPEWSGDTYTFKDLPLKNDAGKQYTYMVEEEDITNYSKSAQGNDFTNIRDRGQFTVKKTIEGNAADTDKKFTFTVTLKKSDGTLFTGKMGGLTFDSNGQTTFELGNGEEKTIEAYVDMTYTVTEDPDGYTTDKPNGVNGTVSTTKATHEFKNTKNTYGDLKVTKKLSGNDTDTNKEFAFTVTLKDKDDAPLANVTIGSGADAVTTDANGKITFKLKGGQDKTIAGIPNGTKYEVSEADYTADGYESVQWTGATSGTINNSSAAENVKVELTATNTRNTYGDVVIKKVETGNDTGKVTDFEFTVTAEDKDGNKLTGTFGAATFANGTATVKVKAGQQAKITDLPNGAKYSIVEKDYTSDDYDAVKWDDTPANKTIVGGQGTNSEVSFTATNNRDTFADLAVKKMLAGNDTDPDKEFAFTVTLKDKNDAVIANTKFGDHTTNANGEITLNIKGGETKTIKDLPNGTKYAVAEADYTGEYYEPVRFSSNKEGTIVGLAEVTTVTATNERNTFGDIKVEKKLTGNDYDIDKDFSFTVTLKDKNDQPLKNVTVGSDTTNANGEITFTLKGGQNKTITGIPNGTKYTVKEADYSKDGYDPVKWTGETSGTIKGAKPVNSLVSLLATNNRDTFGDIEIKKVETGNDTGVVTDFEFTVTAKDKNDDPIVGTYGDAEFINGEATVVLKGDETKTIVDLPNGTKYDIEEADYSAQGYDEVVWTDEAPVEKTIVGGQGTNSKVSFTATNNRDTYGDIKLTKVETGNDKGAVKIFEFVIEATDKEGNPIDGTFGDAEFKDGEAALELSADQTVTISGLPNGTGYHITEKDYSEDDYDAVVFSLKDRDGEAIAEEEAVVEEITASGTILGAQEENSIVEFIATNNRDTYGDLTVVKALDGKGVDETKEFEFTVTLSDETINGEYGDMTFENGVAKFTLMGGESKTAVGLPNDTGYDVEEADYSAEEYVVTEDENKSGDIVGNDKITTTFTNFRDALGSLKVEKKLEGSDVNYEDEFTFEIVLDDASIEGEYGDVSFADGKATFTLKGDESVNIIKLPADVNYTITETDNKGYTSEAENDEGVIVMDDTIAVTFTNKREKGSTEVDVEKVWADEDDAEEIRPDDVTIILLADGKDTGKKLVLNEANAWKGSFKDLPERSDGIDIVYTVEEEKVDMYETSISGNAKDGFVVTNTYVPETPDNPGGKDEPGDPDEPEKNTKPEGDGTTGNDTPPEKTTTPDKTTDKTTTAKTTGKTTTKKTSPKTGDSSNALVYLVLMIGAAGTAVTLYRRRKTEK